MTTYHEPAKELPIVGTYDVLVCGGGTSGIPAAISAARAGARVALIERYGFLGGVPAMCIMPCWHGLNRHHSGLLTEWARRVSGVTPGPDPLRANHMEPEAVKLLALEMLDEAKVEIHLHTWIAGTVKEGNVVRGVITESKSGRRVFLAKVVIDATGDGDVAFHAGAEFRKGDDQGRVQGMTVRFRIGGINFARYFDWMVKPENRPYFTTTHENIAEARTRALAGQDWFLTADLSPLYRQEKNGKDLPIASYFNCSSIRPGELSCNATRVEWLDGTVEEDLTKAEIVCRRQVRALHEFLRRRVDGFENSRLIETAPQIGVRESRVIVGDHVVTEEDCRKAEKCEDPIFRAQVAFDLHNPGNYSCEVLKDDHFTPYRALLTKGLENLMTIGRAMSSDHVANSSTRQMFRVFTVGEVAGLAAAMAVRKNVTPRALPYAELKAGMIERGIRFE